MALLFAENGVDVSLEDPSVEAMDGIIDAAKKQGLHGKITKFTGSQFCPLLSSLQVLHLIPQKTTSHSANPSAPQKSSSSLYHMEPRATVFCQVSCLT